MRRRKKSNYKSYLSWVVYAILSVVIIILLVSVIRRQNPINLVNSWFSTEHVEGDYTTYSKKELISISTAQQRIIDSLSARIAIFEERFGIAQATINVEGDGLNLRINPSILAEILTRIPDETLVQVLEIGQELKTIEGNQNRWYKVKYEDLQGWVWGEYIKIK